MRLHWPVQERIGFYITCGHLDGPTEASFQFEAEQSTIFVVFGPGPKLTIGHADIAITYYNLGKTLTKQAKYLDAEDYFQKTLKIELRELGDDDPDIALTLLWLGESQFHQAKFADAEQNLQKALSLQIAQYSEHDIELKHVLELLRDVSVALGKDTDAQNFAEKIKSLEKS
jgi:tetratricopeptide (TPR) repeat protein